MKYDVFSCLIKKLFDGRYISFLNLSRHAKVSVVKKKFSNKNSVDVIEVKKASSFRKQFNFENKQLFGNLLNKKSSSNGYTSNESGSSQADFLNNNSGTPIKDVCQPEMTIDNQFTKDEFLRGNLNTTLLDFPLVDDVLSEALGDEAKLILERNLLRQHLNSLLPPSNHIPSVQTVLEETVLLNKATHLQHWKMKHNQNNKSLTDKGSSLHNIISMNLSGTPEDQLEISRENSGHWKSLKAVLHVISNIRLLEEHITHPFLNYSGDVDCVGVYKNNLVIVEWKTLKSLRHPISGLFDGRLEVAAYAGALNFDPKWKYMASRGLIVVAFDNGCPATFNYLSEKQLTKHWKLWLKRLSTYWQKMWSIRNRNVF